MKRDSHFVDCSSGCATCGFTIYPIENGGGWTSGGKHPLKNWEIDISGFWCLVPKHCDIADKSQSNILKSGADARLQGA